MLVLTRRVGEAVCFGKNNEIVVVVLEIRGGQVRLGIYAPPEVPVHREEIAERIAREKAKAETAQKAAARGC